MPESLVDFQTAYLNKLGIDVTVSLRSVFSRSSYFGHRRISKCERATEVTFMPRRSAAFGGDCSVAPAIAAKAITHFLQRPLNTRLHMQTTQTYNILILSVCHKNSVLHANNGKLELNDSNVSTT